MTPREELEHAFKTMLGEDIDLSGGSDPDQNMIKVNFEKRRGEIPAWEEMQDLFGDRLLRIMREAYRHEVGRLYQDPDEAITATRAVMVNPCLKLLADAFASGALIGQNQVPVVKRQTHFNEIPKLWEMESFQHEIEVFLLAYQAEDGVAELFRQYLDHSVQGIGECTGYTKFGPGSPGPDIPPEMWTRKVWDIWYIAVKGIISSHYLAGWTLGQKWKTGDLLSALEGEFDGDGGEG